MKLNSFNDRVCVLGAIVAGSATAVFGADTVWLNGGGGGGGGEFIAHVDFNADNDPNTNDLVFGTFCLEKYEYFQKGPSHEYEIKITDRAVGGGNNDDGNNLGYDIISSRTAWIFNEWSKAGNGALSGYSENNVQNAIWQEEDEINNAGANALAIIALAQAAIDGGSWSGLGNVRVMQLWDDAANMDGNHQDQLIIIPMPAPVAMAAAGLLGLGVIRRRR